MKGAERDQINLHDELEWEYKGASLLGTNIATSKPESFALNFWGLVKTREKLSLANQKKKRKSCS